MRHVTSIDGPINGYVDRHSDGEYLGIFRLTPGAIKSRNRAPRIERVWDITEFGNEFIGDEVGMDFFIEE